MSLSQTPNLFSELLTSPNSLRSLTICEVFCSRSSWYDARPLAIEEASTAAKESPLLLLLHAAARHCPTPRYHPGLCPKLPFFYPGTPDLPANDANANATPGAPGAPHSLSIRDRRRRKNTFRSIIPSIALAASLQIIVSASITPYLPRPSALFTSLCLVSGSRNKKLIAKLLC